MTTFDKSKCLRLLTKRGVSKATVYFSGGNDEGSIDSIEYVMLDGSEPPKIVGAAISYIYNADSKKWEEDWSKVPDEQRDDTELINALEAIVDDRYGTFAGDFYVNGEVVYDVAAGTVHMNGAESVEVADSFEEDY